MSERQYEIVLYGASGFTGKLVAEYLAGEHAQLNWAIAGRNEQKLDQVRRELGVPDLPIVVADSSDAGQLTAMARQTRTLISTVGPYAQYGTPVLEACANEGTHYCDLTGEAQWMAQVMSELTLSPRPAARVWCIAVALTRCPPTCLSIFFKSTFANDTDITLPGCLAVWVVPQVASAAVRWRA